jgi:hypothetical protein
MPEPAKTVAVAERATERRRVPRISFKGASVVAETGSSRIVISQTCELSRFGCFVQAPEPFPPGTKIHIEMAYEGATFAALGRVAYVTGEGMGIVFGVVEPDNQAVLETWLAQ